MMRPGSHALIWSLTYATLVGSLAIVAGCRRANPEAVSRASGYVDATETRVASRIAGRIQTVAAREGATVAPGDVVATLSPVDVDLALARTRAERAQAAAQLRLLRAGARSEDVRQSEAQVAAAQGDRRAAEAELAAARSDEARFEQLLRNKAGSQKQRDDAVSRRELAEARVAAATDRVAALTATAARVTAGSRAEEIEAAAARVEAVDAQIAILMHDREETTITAPTGGVVTSRLVEPGELVAPGAPVAVILDLAHAWVNAYVEEPMIPAVRIGMSVRVRTDSGASLTGSVAVVADRAEFTPRNVQTSAERAKLVFRVKVTVDNREGLLKPGMPVDVELTGH